MTTLSIIIISFNTRHLLKNCLNSIRKYPPPAEFEIIVVDNGSEDGTQQMLRSEFQEVRLIQNSGNLGFAKAANRGILESSGEYIYFLNSDTELLENSAGILLAYLQLHPDTGIAGAREQFANGRSYPTICPFPDICFLFLSHTGFRHRFYSNRRINPYRHKWEKATASGKPVSADWISGANMMIRKKLFEKVGFFDENYFFYLEETDLCKRAWEKKWKVMYIPQAAVIHHGGGSAGKTASGLLALSAALSDLYYIRKHRSPFEFFLLKLMFVCEYTLKLFLLGSTHSHRTAYRQILRISAGLKPFQNPYEYATSFRSKSGHA